MPPTFSSSLRAGRQRGVDISSPPANLANRTRGSCSYYPPDATGCRAPRSCYDCLNLELDNEPEGCMINKIGRCVSVVANYDASLDFRVVPRASFDDNERAFNGDWSRDDDDDGDDGDREMQSRFRRRGSREMSKMGIPAVNATYCEGDDILFNKVRLANDGFRYGTNGCVFVEVCERPRWAYVVGGSDCSRANTEAFNGLGDNDSSDGQSDTSRGYLAFWCVAVAIILTLVATLAMVITIHHYHGKRRLQERQRRTIAVGGSIASTSRCMALKAGKNGAQPLNLSGWEAMRANLIEKEHCEMQEKVGANVSPASDNHVPSAPSSANYVQLVGIPATPTSSSTSTSRLSELLQ